MRRSVVTTLLIILLTSCLLWANVWQRQQAQFRRGMPVNSAVTSWWP